MYLLFLSSAISSFVLSLKEVTWSVQWEWIRIGLFGFCFCFLVSFSSCKWIFLFYVFVSQFRNTCCYICTRNGSIRFASDMSIIIITHHHHHEKIKSDTHTHSRTKSYCLCMCVQIKNLPFTKKRPQLNTNNTLSIWFWHTLCERIQFIFYFSILITERFWHVCVCAKFIINLASLMLLLARIKVTIFQIYLYVLIPSRKSSFLEFIAIVSEMMRLPRNLFHAI